MTDTATNAVKEPTVDCDLRSSWSIFGNVTHRYTSLSWHGKCASVAHFCWRVCWKGEWWTSAWCDVAKVAGNPRLDTSSWFLTTSPVKHFLHSLGAAQRHALFHPLPNTQKLRWSVGRRRLSEGGCSFKSSFSLCNISETQLPTNVAPLYLGSIWCCAYYASS